MPTSQRGSSQRDSGWRPQRRSTGLNLQRPPEGLILAVAAVGLIYTAHILYGALSSDVAMGMGCAAAVILGFCLFDPWIRQDLLRLKGLAWPGLAMVLALLAAALALTPWGPGGPHPVWDYVNAPVRATTLDRSTSLVEIVKLMGLACLFLVGAAAGSSDARARTALNLTVAFGALFGLWFFFAFVSGAVYQTQARRLEAHFLNPNTAGTVFGVLLVLAAGLLTRRLKGAERGDRLWASLPLACAGLIFLACLIATASRAAFGATLIALLLFGVVQAATGRWKVRAAVLGGLAALTAGGLVLAAGGGVLADRLVGTGEAAASRAYVWKIHWEAFLSAPLLGYGPGAFETVNKTLISASNFRELWNIRAAMNVYLQWLEQGGLIGAAPMFACVALTIVMTFRGALERSRMTGPLFALIAADLLVLVHGATDFALETPSVSAFWAFLLGLQFAPGPGERRAMSVSARIKLAVAGALAVATLAASGAVMVALNGGGAARIGPWTVLEIAAGYDRAADAQMATMRPAALKEAQRLSRLAIAQNPYDTSAWLRIASADALLNGRLTVTGVEALSRSYDLVGVDPYVATWRTAFALEHWQDLPAALKAETRSEAMAVGRPWSHREKMLRALAGVRNPKGRMTAAIWAARLKASDRS